MDLIVFFESIITLYVSYWLDEVFINGSRIRYCLSSVFDRSGKRYQLKQTQINTFFRLWVYCNLGYVFTYVYMSNFCSKSLNKGRKGVFVYSNDTRLTTTEGLSMRLYNYGFHYHDPPPRKLSSTSVLPPREYLSYSGIFSPDSLWRDGRVLHSRVVIP